MAVSMDRADTALEAPEPLVVSLYLQLERSSRAREASLQMRD
jgi:hypothetical protein